MIFPLVLRGPIEALCHEWNKFSKIMSREKKKLILILMKKEMKITSNYVLILQYFWKPVMFEKQVERIVQKNMFI